MFDSTDQVFNLACSYFRPCDVEGRDSREGALRCLQPFNRRFTVAIEKVNRSPKHTCRTKNPVGLVGGEGPLLLSSREGPGRQLHPRHNIVRRKPGVLSESLEGIVGKPFFHRVKQMRPVELPKAQKRGVIVRARCGCRAVGVRRLVGVRSHGVIPQVASSCAPHGRESSRTYLTTTH